MEGFRRSEGRLVAVFEPQEIETLGSLLEQLIELLGDEVLGAWNGADQAEQDIFARLEWELSEQGIDDLCADPDVDPVLRRLFPNAYPDDPAASFDFRRFTQCAQREAKIDGCCRVGDDLRHSHEGRVQIDDVNVPAWLITLTNVRLALAVRLGIDDAEIADELAELPQSHPRAWIFSIYEWLGWVQESMLACLDEG